MTQKRRGGRLVLD